MRIVFSFLPLIFLVTGCLVGPNYQPPANPVEECWNSPAALEVNPCELYNNPPIAWWELFEDPQLNKYIEAAAFFNNDVLIAESSIWQARALKTVTASALFPQIEADLNASRTYFSKNGPVFAIGTGGTNVNTGLPFQIQVPQTQTLYNALIDASWEIDLFGKTRRSIEAAEAQIGGAIEQRNGILISVLAEVARNYIELRSYQELGLLIEENIALLERTSVIIHKRFKTGYSSRLDVERIEAELAQARANLPHMYAQIYQSIYALSILTGSLPETLLCELLPFQPLPHIPPTLAIGIRSDVLRRRPDVRQAERNLAAATANIGVAVASFFPSFSLTGDIGFQSLHLNNLFQAQSLTWAIGGEISIPIFQGGYLVGNLHLSEAQAASAAFAYQKAVLTALKEAESHLIAYSEQLRTAQLLGEAAHQYRKLLTLTNERHKKGLINLTDVLDIERQWNQTEQNWLNSKMTLFLDLISLYKALGGGWQPDTCL